MYMYVRPQKRSLVSRNRPGEKFLSLNRPHSRMCIRIYILDFKKQQTNKKTRIKKTKETKEEKNISGKWIKRKKFAAARVRVFLVTRISRNKSGLFLVLSFN